MNRIFASLLGLSLAVSTLFSPWARAQTNTSAGQSVARINSSGEADEAKGSQAPALDRLPKFSGNIPGSVNEDRTYGVNAPGTLIGPSPDLGQPDPRFAGGVQGEAAGVGQVGGSSSDINEGLPAASKNNSGGNAGGASGGTGGGANGTEVNAGGDAVVGKSGDAAQRNSGTADIGRETGGAAPYAIFAGAVIIGAFLFTAIRGRGMR